MAPQSTLRPMKLATSAFSGVNARSRQYHKVRNLLGPKESPQPRKAAIKKPPKTRALFRKTSATSVLAVSWDSRGLSHPPLAASRAVCRAMSLLGGLVSSAVNGLRPLLPQRLVRASCRLVGCSLAELRAPACTRWSRALSRPPTTIPANHHGSRQRMSTSAEPRGRMMCFINSLLSDLPLQKSV